MYLNNVNDTCYYIVNKINANELVKRRLYDIGLISGTKIKRLFISPSKKIKAYLIRDSIIAIRDTDAKLIRVDRYD